MQIWKISCKVLNYSIKIEINYFTNNKKNKLILIKLPRFLLQNNI